MNGCDFCLIKNLDNANAWIVSHKSIVPNVMCLNDSGAAGSTPPVDGPYGAITQLNSSTITLTSGTSGPDNVAKGGSNWEYIAYCFTSIPGFSAFGSYISAGATSDSNFVYLGFKPALLMLKATGAATGFESYISWGIYDNARQTTNPNHSPLFANKSITEGYRGNGTTSTGGEGLIVDFLSNGFKLRQESAEFSGSNTNPIIFAAFADLPFSYARGR